MTCGNSIINLGPIYEVSSYLQGSGWGGRG